MNSSKPPFEPSSRRSFASRRRIICGGVATSLAIMGIAAFPPAQAAQEAASHDVMVLNGALYYEHQAIWVYSVATQKLSQTDVGKAVLKLALANQADHEAHRDTLIQIIRGLRGQPVAAQADYDLSSYWQQGHAINSDETIAKLALALEVDAAIAYAREIAKLKTPELITAGATIAAAEAAHATAIRVALTSLGAIDSVPAAFVSADTRDAWVKV